jgi:hypothetical protein
MKPGSFQLSAKTRNRIARWISFLALAALLAMATLPAGPSHRDVAADYNTHWSETWHG